MDSYTKSIQKISFTGNLEEDNAAMFFNIEEAKENILAFSKGTVKVFYIYFVLI